MCANKKANLGKGANLRQAVRGGRNAPPFADTGPSPCLGLVGILDIKARDLVAFHVEDVNHCFVLKPMVLLF